MRTPLDCEQLTLALQRGGDGPLSSEGRKDYELREGHLIYLGRLHYDGTVEDLSRPADFVGVAMWVERDGIWRLAALTPGGGLLRLAGGGCGEGGQAAARAAGESLGQVLGIPLLIGPGRGPVTGWLPGPSLVQEGPGPVPEDAPVLLEQCTALTVLLTAGGAILFLAGCLGLGVGYGMQQTSWPLWAWPLTGAGGLMLLARSRLSEWVCIDPGSRTVARRRIFNGLQFTKPWCQFADLEAVALSCANVGHHRPVYAYTVVLVRRDGEQLKASPARDYDWAVAEAQELGRVCQTRAFIPSPGQTLVFQYWPEGVRLAYKSRGV